jgi:8-amino-7-oxononanoate synthase
MRGPLFLRRRLDDIDFQGLYRHRRTVESPQAAEIRVEGRWLVNFCSNDYLGLANHPLVIAALQRGASEYGVGAGAAHLVCGHGGPHQALEEELATFMNRDRALLFSTGYMANMGVISALLARGDAVFEDRLNHASLLDGARLSGARLQRYGHGDSSRLQALLSGTLADQILIATDGVFSMDGYLAPVDELSVLAKQHDAWLMIDDAHGVGVLGENGRGLLEVTGHSQDEVPIVVGTLGKAFGTFGAFVAGSDDLIEYLIQRARTYIYTTALPPAIAEATRASLILVKEDSWRRDRLAERIQQFKRGAQDLGLKLVESITPIQPLVVGDNQAALDASDQLCASGFWVSAIRPPTVPDGTARLRITLTSIHTEDQVDRLLEALSRLPLIGADRLNAQGNVA